MKSIILAAGRGSRMGALTEDRPKCLVELDGCPLLDLQCAALVAGGAEEIAVVTGYLGECIAVRGLRCFTNPRWQQTNMVMSLHTAREWLQRETCIVSYSDIFYPAETIRRLVAAQGDIVISFDPDWLPIWQGRFADPLADAETFRRDGAGRLVEIGGKASHVDQIEGQYMGLLRFTPSGWACVEEYLNGLRPEEQDRLDMTGLLSRLIAGGVRIDTVPTFPGWGEIDSETDTAWYEEQIRLGCLSIYRPSAG